MAAWRGSLWVKVAASGVLVVVADRILFGEIQGWTLGAFALMWTVVLVIVRPAVGGSTLGRIGVVVALVLAVVMVERPGLLLWALFWCSLSVAALSPRGPADDVWRWAQRLAIHGLRGPGRPVFDLWRIHRLIRLTGHSIDVMPAARLVVVPVTGGLVFLGLFAGANPVIAQLLQALRLPMLTDETIGRTIFGGLVFVSVWEVFRARSLRRPIPLVERTSDLDLAWLNPTSVVLSLAVFNTVFALQNGLDIAFLWSGAPLPEGVTLADYAHRGAYALIFTAILAGLFILVVLRPGSAAAAPPLVGLWVAQNLLLVASSILRTLDYVEVYSLTVLRIAALVWMVLVAVGLILICWRQLKGRSATWLVNTNALALGIVLLGSSVVDFGAVAAAWNVRHAREVGGAGAALDVCYLERLGPAALVSLAELEQRPLPADLRGRVAGVRQDLQMQLDGAQSDWRRWTFRGDRRLKAVQNLPSQPVPELEKRYCSGRLVHPPPVPAPTVQSVAPVSSAPVFAGPR